VSLLPSVTCTSPSCSPASSSPRRATQQTVGRRPQQYQHAAPPNRSMAPARGKVSASQPPLVLLAQHLAAQVLLVARHLADPGPTGDLVCWGLGGAGSALTLTRSTRSSASLHPRLRRSQPLPAPGNTSSWPA
jgi:hypothetical protein